MAPRSAARKPWWRRWFGSHAERAAARYLRRLGWRIVARNWSCPHGELDIVAVEGRTVVFVEVRSTGGDDPEVPAASVDSVKQARLTRLGLAFLQRHGLLDLAARFDVLAVQQSPGQREPTIIHHRLAFEAAGRFQFYC
jgi:putative endonuclease